MSQFRVAVIIVTYFPNVVELSSNIQNLLSEGAFVFLYRNCKTKLPFSNTFGFEIQGNGNNIGLASAQNIGLRHILELNIDFILTIDQDSLVDKNYINKALHRLICLNNLNSKIRVVVPLLIDKFTNNLISKEYVIEKLDADVDILREATCSGMLMFSSVIKDFGVFHDHLFIDYIDFEWSWRIRSFGVKIARLNDLSLKHSLGEGDINIFGRFISVCSSDRIYYQVRNLKHLKHLEYVPVFWIFKQKIKLFFRIFFYLVLKRDIRYVKSFYNGLMTKYMP